MPSQHHLSVVIPTRARAQFLKRTLACLAAQTLPKRDYEVIVVNDGGDKETARAARDLGRDVPLRYFTIQAGSAGAARNLGARHATARVILFIDDECLSERTFLASHLAAHKRAGRPAVVRGPTGPVLTRWDKSVFGAMEASDQAPAGKTSGWLVGVEDILKDGFKPLFPLAGPRRFYDQALRAFGPDLGGCLAPWPLFLTRNVSVARPLWEAVGGFDESLPAAGLEDLELGYRLHRLGAPFRLEPSAPAYWQLCAVDKPRKARRLAQHYRLICGKHRDMGILLVWKLITGALDFPGFNRAIEKHVREEKARPETARRAMRRAEALAKQRGWSARYLLRAL